MERILIVDEEREYTDNLGGRLMERGYIVRVLEDPFEAIAEFVKKSFDLVVADYHLQRLDGLKMLAAMKEINPYIKTILLDACNQESVELQSIENKVELYFPKDKKIQLLEQHIIHMGDAAHAHRGGKNQLISAEDGIVIDTKTHTVYKDGRKKEISRKEYELLCLLLRNRGKAMSREEILNELWNPALEMVSARTIDGYIKKLRSKLGLYQLVSVRGYGYEWI